MEAVAVDQGSFLTAPEVITVVEVISEVGVTVGAEEEGMVEIEEEEVVDEATFVEAMEAVEVVEEGLPENRVPGSLRMSPSKNQEDVIAKGGFDLTGLIET